MQKDAVAGVICLGGTAHAVLHSPPFGRFPVTGKSLASGCELANGFHKMYT